MDFKEKIEKAIYENIRSLELVPNEGCNLGCVYCSIPKIKPTTFSDETVNNIIEIYKRNTKIININFIGGEPITNETVPQLIKILKGIKNIRKVPEICIMTNGYEWSDEIAEFYKLYFTVSDYAHVNVSLDEGPEIHNKSRRNKDKKVTYENILNNIKNIIEIYKTIPNKNKKYFMNVKSTFSGHKLANLRESVIGQHYNLDVLKDYLDYIELDNVIEMRSHQYGNYDGLYKQISDITYEYLNGQYEYKVMSSVLNLIAYPLDECDNCCGNCGHCSLITHHISVLHDGSVVPCSQFGSALRDKHILYNINTHEVNPKSYDVYTGLLKVYKKQSNLGYDCSKCDAKSICKACVALSYLYHGDINIMGDDLCLYILVTTKVLQDIFYNGKKLNKIQEYSKEWNIVYENFAAYKNKLNSIDENHPDYHDTLYKFRYWHIKAVILKVSDALKEVDDPRYKTVTERI